MIYKQYQAGFYGLATAGNVILFLLIARPRPAARPGGSIGRRWTCDAPGASPTAHRRAGGVPSCGAAALVAFVLFVVPFLFIAFQAVKTRREASRLSFAWPTEWQLWQNFRDVIQERNYMLLLAYFNSTSSP